MLQPRPYQTAAIEALRAAFRSGFRRLLLRAPTGAGKTIIACLLIHGAVGKGTRVLFLAHRSELIEQCSRKLTEAGVPHGIIKAGYPMQASFPVQVASVQSLRTRDTLPPGLIFVDEAHHTNAATYLGILNRFPQATVVGLTATPARTDGRGLGEVYQIIIPTVDYWTLLEHGFLCPMRLVEPACPDMKGVRTVGGDYSPSQKAERMRSGRLYGDIVSTWLERAQGRKTLMFTASVAHSLDLCAAFRARGVVAEHVDGTTDEDRRARLIREVQDGAIDILSNVGIATEGTDLPAVSCMILANPTKSIIMHHQMVGRGLRVHPEKDDCLILDHAGNHSRLGSVADDIAWTLDGAKRKTSEEEEKAPSVRICPKCFLTMRGGTPVCPSCGHQFKIEGRKPETKTAEMKESDTIQKQYRTRYDPLTYYARKVMQGKGQGYRPGWAKLQYKLVFGDWPAFSHEQVSEKCAELALEAVAA